MSMISPTWFILFMCNTVAFRTMHTSLEFELTLYLLYFFGELVSSKRLINIKRINSVSMTVALELSKLSSAD